MLAGPRADAVTWFDDRGAWVTSTAYAAAPVPAVADFVRANPVEADLGKIWDRALPLDRYLFEAPAIGITIRPGPNTFPHPIVGAGAEPDGRFYTRWQNSPFSDDYLARMALGVSRSLDLGREGHTDFLGVSFSALDKVGHEYGPNSHEIQDVLIRLDRALGGLLDGLDQLVGRGRYVVALCADHGVAPLPERARTLGQDAGRVSSRALLTAIEEGLTPLGPGRHFTAFVGSDAYLEPGVMAELRKRPEVLVQLRAGLLKVPGISAVYTRDELQADRFDEDPIGRRVAHGFVPDRSGDLTVVLKPYWILASTGTTHGTPFDYDTHVPLVLMGQGIAGGVFQQPATPADIAPTLAVIAGVTLPQATGRVLTEALRPAGR
jgi:predicted AlkP superfamily pyrophosphatase or phosphodiesterase